MRNQDKAARLAAAALENACRLHRDSVLLFREHRYPSAFQLAVLAQEEVGKSFRLEEYIFRVRVGERDAGEGWREVAGDILSHKTKQLWFAKQEWDQAFLEQRRLGYVARLLESARLGRLEGTKQDAALVGLTRDKRGRLDPNGRIVRPWVRIGERQAAEQVTRVSDVLTVWVEGYQRGVLGPDMLEVEQVLTEELEKELHGLWPTSRATSRTLARWRDLPREHWMGGTHDEG